MVRYPTWLIVTFGLLFSSLSAQIALTSIDPDSAAQGDNLSVYIIGQGTNFAQGTGVTNVWFSQGSSTIFSNFIWPGSNTTLTAYFAIPIDALIGLWDLSVNSSEDGNLTLANAFTVNPAGTPEIISIEPDSAYQGEYLPVNIIGLHTHFDQGSGVTGAWFSQGSSTIFSYSFWPGNNTTLRAYFAIPIDALIGLWDLSVNSGVDGTLTLTDGFRIPVTPPPAIVAVDPDSAYQANDLWVIITGRQTHFNQGSGTTAVWLENGEEVIQAENFWAWEPQIIDAIFNLPLDALTGLWDLSVTDAMDGTLTLLDGITILPFRAAPEITNISDVPADQGRWVNVTWNASDYDIINFEGEYPGLYVELTQYGIWELDLENNWVSLGSTPAVQSSAYTYLAATFGDSSAYGTVWSRFQVTAQTSNPAIYYTSPVDSGYSIDNLALGLEGAPGLPAEYALHPAYPNPFNPSTTIAYDLPQAGPVALVVYDLRGREVARLAEGRRAAGYHQVTWAGRDAAGREVPTGIYILRLTAPGYTKSIKMLLLK